MDFEFTEEQEMLRDSVRRFLTERAPLTYVRDQLQVPAVVDDIWRGLPGLGLAGMLVPEAAGGSGMGLVDLALPLGEMGRSVYPGPFAASCVGAAVMLTAVDTTPETSAWLAGIAAGTNVVVLALTDSPATPANLNHDNTVSGVKVHTLDGMAADILLVGALTPSGPTVVAVESSGPGVTRSATQTVDATRKFATVTLDHAPIFQLAGDTASAQQAADDALGTAMVLDGLGAAERALELTLEYAKDRQQFGKPIGSFQAVQHLCADMLRALELGRAAGYYAAWACDAADPVERHRAATMARAFAADSLYRVGANAIQIFGGIGFTWEHDIHLFYKRLLTLQLFGGTASDHLAELAAIAL